MVAAVALTACSSGDDDGGGGPLGGGGGDGFAAQIAALPLPPDVDDDEVLMVSFGDLARAAELAGVDLPAARDGDRDAQIDAINALLGVQYDPEGSDGSGSSVAVLPPEAAQVDRLQMIEEFTDEVGWNLFDVRQFVEVPSPPNDVTVLQGDFDEDALTEAMGEPEDGVWVLGTPGEINVDEVSAARPIGEGLLLSLDGDRLIVAKTEEGMAVARGGDGATVGDDGVLTGLAEALEDADAYSGMLLRGNLGGPAGGTGVSPAQAEALCEEALSVPFVGVGAGIAYDDGPVFLLAYLTAAGDAAETLAGEVEELVTEGVSAVSAEPWSDRLVLDEVTADGNVVVARLRPAEEGPAAIWHRFVLNRDNLVSYC